MCHPLLSCLPSRFPDVQSLYRVFRLYLAFLATTVVLAPITALFLLLALRSAACLAFFFRISILWTFGVQELEPSPSGPFLTVVCPSIGRPGGTGVRSLGWQGCCGSAIVCPSSAPLHFSMLRSLYFLTAPLPSRVLLWRSSPWPSLPWVQWSLLLSLLQGFLQPSLRVVVVLGVLASSHDPLPSPLFL